MGESIADKAAHVRAAKRRGDTLGHHCHWPGCEKKVPPVMWGCTYHWYQLPQRLRNKVWHAYRTGQEMTKTPSGEYITVAREVQNWIWAQELLK